MAYKKQNIIKLKYHNNPIALGSIKLYLLWFDSMGAKCSSIFIETPDIKLLVDPGAASMQPSYPLSEKEKVVLRNAALNTIEKFAKKADTVFISHYHYDHHTLPKERNFYKNKKLWIKEPNRWINNSQWHRARLFLSQLCKINEKKSIEEMFILPLNKEKLSEKDEEKLDEKDKKRIKKLIEMWNTLPWIKEFNNITYIDGKEMTINKTKIKFTNPLFHGEEFSKIGWVIAFTLIYEKYKILYASDIQGPIIEEYADFIIKENPDALILDGPPTYLLGYTLSFKNLERAKNNIQKILKNTKTKYIIYDHHLPRDINFQEKMAPLYEKNWNGRLLMTSEFYGTTPIILKLKNERK